MSIVRLRVNEYNALLGTCRGAPGWDAVPWVPRAELAVSLVARNLEGSKYLRIGIGANV